MITAKRVPIFDILRGFMLINMIFYHLFYDMVYILGFKLSWYHSDLAFLWQEIIAGTFIFVSGACSYYSKNNLKRGGFILLAALAVTVVTSYLGEQFIVVFGILHCLGICMVLFHFLRPILNKIPIKLGFFISIFIYFLSAPLQDMYFSINLFPIGIRTKDFMSSDYFPLIPYFFMFLGGSFFAKFNLLDRLNNVRAPFLEYLGRHSLLVYLIHQPIIYLFIQIFSQ